MTPIACLQAASAKFKRHYSRPSDKHGPLHNADADWAAATQSYDVFRAHIAHLMIPHHLSNIIWEAITDVPNQAGRTRLQEDFTQPPSYEDYLTAIKSHKKDTAPGMTGFSYRHLKTLPEDLYKATYNMLCTLWPTQHIPDYWKQRWLIPLPKTEELTSIEDLRPISSGQAYSLTASAPPGNTLTCSTLLNMDSVPNTALTAHPSFWWMH